MPGVLARERGDGAAQVLRALPGDAGGKVRRRILRGDDARRAGGERRRDEARAVHGDERVAGTDEAGIGLDGHGWTRPGLPPPYTAGVTPLRRMRLPYLRVSPVWTMRNAFLARS